jgi:hypothetical protein
VTTIRPDTELYGLDVPAAITRGLLLDGVPRRMLYSDAAIAAALAAEARDVGPYPVHFLAGYVRTAGVDAALALPEPLIAPEQAELARDWLHAARAAGAGLEFDALFARWLEMVAAVLAVRRAARDRADR